MEPKVKREYWDNGNIRREDWTLPNGKYHREDGPAMILYYENGNKEREQWSNNDKCHREYKPAQTWYNKDGSIALVRYWINGKEDWKITRLPDTKIKRALYS